MNLNSESKKHNKKRKERKKEIKCASIISSAEQLFIEKGYSSATVDEIAFNSGITKATMYKYFESKEDLFTAVLAKSYGLFYDILIEKFSSIKGKNSLRKLADAYIFFENTNPKLSEFLNSGELVLINKKIYEKIAEGKSLTESEMNYKMNEDKIKDIQSETIESFVNDPKLRSKIGSVFGYFAITIREVLSFGKLANRTEDENKEILEIIFQIIEQGIINYEK